MTDARAIAVEVEIGSSQIVLIDRCRAKNSIDMESTREGIQGAIWHTIR